MTVVSAIIRAVIALFLDDGLLASAILGVIFPAAILAQLTPRMPLVAGAVLLLGCLAALVINVMKAARR